jgi:hypothetical protein
MEEMAKNFLKLAMLSACCVFCVCNAPSGESSGIGALARDDAQVREGGSFISPLGQYSQEALCMAEKQQYIYQVKAFLPLIGQNQRKCAFG